MFKSDKKDALSVENVLGLEYSVFNTIPIDKKLKYSLKRSEITYETLTCRTFKILTSISSTGSLSL